MLPDAARSPLSAARPAALRPPPCSTALCGALLAASATLAGACRAPEGVTPQTSGAAASGALAAAFQQASTTHTYFAAQLDEVALRELERDCPNLRLVVGLSYDEALARAGEADGIDARYCTSEFLQRAPSLRWVQASSAGVERLLAVPGLAERGDVVVTNMRGVHGPAIADHVFAMLLCLTRGLRPYLDAHSWAPGDDEPPTLALSGRTLFVVGLGGIGGEVAKRAKGFGMRVVATRRSATPAPPEVDVQGGPDDLERFLELADVVVLCVPLTAETEGMIGSRQLARMKPGAILVNVGRGKLVDTVALVEALREGSLGGACLDVTDPEPLPPGHALWSIPNAIVTPHVAGRAALTEERQRALLLDNLRRFAAGDELQNRVDRSAGY